jgi:hypothetical protein
VAGVIYNFEIAIAIFADLDERVDLLADLCMAVTVGNSKFFDIVMVVVLQHFAKWTYLLLHRQLRVLCLPPDQKHIHPGVS